MLPTKMFKVADSSSRIALIAAAAMTVECSALISSYQHITIALNTQDICSR